MITENALKLINYRIEQEEYSSRLYHYMALCLEDMGYEYAPKVFEKYSIEEMEHAKWAKDYLLAFGVKPYLTEIAQPECMCESLSDVIIKAYEHEKEISNQCNEFAKEAIKMNDYMLYTLAIKYCKEQIEEIGKIQNLLDKLKTYGSDKIALKLIDNDLQKEL